jgi:hypothetical protein
MSTNKLTSTIIKHGRDSLFAGLLTGAVFVSPNAFAEDIYKIVDEEGDVTYSSVPPGQDQKSEVIETPPPPPEEEVEAAIERQRRIETEFDKLDQTRAEQARWEAERRASNTTTVVQTNTILGGTPWYYGPYQRGALTAPGAPTAPGWRPPHRLPPHYKRPGNRQRPPVAVPYARPGP